MNHDGSPNDESLRWQLRALRRESLPQADLWPGIAARILRQAQDDRESVFQDTPAGNVAPRRRRGADRFAPWALAASLVLVVGVAWQQRPDFDRSGAASGAGASARLIHREADAMTREYAAALRELQASAAPRVSDPSLHQLDRSAAQIRSALDRDPDARFLLDRLRSTYEKRLALTQRELTT